MDINKESPRQRRMRELRESKIEQNNANIEYIAMMADIVLPESEEMTNEMVRENQEVL